MKPQDMKNWIGSARDWHSLEELFMRVRTSARVQSGRGGTREDGGIGGQKDRSMALAEYAPISG
jgi:hypothetical protein